MFSPHRSIARRVSASRNVGVADITLVICVRAHDANPWVIDRLEALSTLYDQLPEVVIVDFGSDEQYATKIKSICEEDGFSYRYVDDKGVYSASKARNAGFCSAKTEFVFFTDIDFVYPTDFFSRLARTISALTREGQIDTILMCSAVHLSEASTSSYVSMQAAEQSDFLELIGHRAIYTGFGEDVQFVAPYSNNFLIHRDLFALSGGYHENFRGHGSEDFEFISRLNYYTQHHVVPTKLSHDFGGPLRAEFFNQQSYEGFRAINAVTCLAGELQGLKAYHLYHPTSNDDGWRAENDWRRDRLSNVMAEYVSDQRGLLAVDSLDRDKRVLCICKQADHWGYFAPLRLLGYRIDVISEATAEILAKAAADISANVYDALAIFNPYMKSHAAFKPLYLLAKEKVQTIVVERGALPGTIYYASDVAYVAPEYGQEAFEAFVPTSDQVATAGSYMRELRSGEARLEVSHDYQRTAEKHAALGAASKKKIFIPLQLPEDMAVTMFVRPAQSYADFQASIAHLGAYEDVIFIVKPHPLSKVDLAVVPENVVVLDRMDNIHAIIDISDAVIAYNSGVSLLAMAHEKPVYTIGNAYFNKGGAARWADNMGAAIVDFLSGPWQASPDAIRRVFAWLDHLYSRFTAVDDVREFAERKAHGYRDVVVEHLNLGRDSIPMGRVLDGRRRTARTYAMGRLNYAPPKPGVQRQVEPAADKYERWARDDFSGGRFEASARNFRLAFAERGPKSTHLLRWAAEAHLKAGQKADAVVALEEASRLLPNNKAVRRRLTVVRWPMLRAVLGDKPFAFDPRSAS